MQNEMEYHSNKIIVSDETVTIDLNTVNEDKDVDKIQPVEAMPSVQNTDLNDSVLEKRLT